MSKLERQTLPDICLRVLGRFAVLTDGGAGPELRISARKGQALLAYLAMHPEHGASREHLAALFWGDRQDERARHSLRQCLVSLRRDLLKDNTDILLMDANTVGLDTTRLRIDAVEFVSLAESAEASDLERAAELYRGECLSGFSFGESFDSWLHRTRGQLEDVAAHVFEKCTELADARGDGRQAIAAVERLIALDTFREDWQRTALRIYARHRGREFALAHADACVALLKRELGVDPEPATQTLIEDIRQGAISTVAPAGAGEPPETVSGNAPTVPVDERRIGVMASIFASVRERASVHRRAVLAVLAICVSAFVLASAIVFPWLDEEASERAMARPAVVPIVVLPFTAGDGADAATENAAGALTEAVTDTLARFAGFGVISRQTARTYRDRQLDAAAIGSELGVRYVVEGSIRNEAGHATINVHLIETADQLQVWSDRFERDDIDRAQIQDEIAIRVARGVQVAVTFAEAGRPAEDRARPPAVDNLVMKGWAVHFSGPSRNNAAEELTLFEEALRREPDYVPAMLGVGMALTQAVLNSLADDPRGSLERAEEQLNRVLEKDPSSYRAYFWKALVAKARERYEEALELLSKSIELNPGVPHSYAQRGDVLTKLGRPAEGLEQIQYAIRVSPKDASIAFFYLFAGKAELELHHEAEAAEWFRRSIAAQPGNPTPYKYLAATYALLGNRTEAAECWAQFRRLSAPPAVSDLAGRLRQEPMGASRPSSPRLREGLRRALTL
jgi:DNA-binding SARP family transcriptional activator/TolB-like protein/cytochrome c-type biogenesis protein CcmH/NrfG